MRDWLVPPKVSMGSPSTLERPNGTQFHVGLAVFLRIVHALKILHP